MDVRTDSPEIIGPVSSYFVSQRLRLHYVDWGNTQAPPLVLVHGGRDHARSFDFVARHLRDRFHVVAPDLRGHGDSAWAIGSSYPLIDFVYDLAQLVESLGDQPVTLLGHSFGGVLSMEYAAIVPERVRRIVNVEGFGPPPGLMERWRERPLAEQAREWFEQMRGLAARRPRRYASLDDAAKRMQEENPSLSPELARHLTVHGIARNEDGTWSWKFDNYFRSMPPRVWDPGQRLQTWRRIDCPTLLVRGTRSWAADPRQSGLLDALAQGSCVEIDGAAHWVHHDRFDDFVREVDRFIAADAEA